MKVYTTRAGNIRNIVLGFSIPLLLFIMLFVNGLINGEQMSTGTFMWIYGVALIMVVIAMTLFVYGVGARKTKLSIENDKLVLNFRERKDRRSAVEIPFSHIRGYYSSNLYWGFESTAALGRFIVFIPGGRRAEDRALGYEMTKEIGQAIAAWNLTAANPVKHIHIYESTWGKGFAALWAALIIYLVITFLATRHSIPFSSIVVMLYGVAYIGKVCYYNFFRNKAGNEPAVL